PRSPVLLHLTRFSSLALSPGLFPPLLRHSHRPHCDLHSFPTRRSSDLPWVMLLVWAGMVLGDNWQDLKHQLRGLDYIVVETAKLDRKSTRLNSSHQIISYAVFCLKKKKK